MSSWAVLVRMVRLVVYTGGPRLLTIPQDQRPSSTLDRPHRRGLPLRHGHRADHAGRRAIHHGRVHDLLRERDRVDRHPALHLRGRVPAHRADDVRAPRQRLGVVRLGVPRARLRPAAVPVLRELSWLLWVEGDGKLTMCHGDRNMGRRSVLGRSLRAVS